MAGKSRPALPICLIATAILITNPAAGQDSPGSKPDLGWHNSTDLSFVLTEGNSDAETIGFKNILGKRWEKSRFQLKLDATKSDTADDRILVVASGVECQVGATPPQAGTRIEEPPVEPDVEKYFAEVFYDRDILEEFRWRAGASWDRDRDAGILDRYIGFASVGHQWRETKTLVLYTGYGLSYTDREEESPDPEKEDKFAGLRFDGTWNAKASKAVGFENDVTANMSLKDTGDYSVEVNNALAVSMTEKLSLKISFRWLYNHEPALEDLDVIARVIIVDPDGTPGTGDERFRTVDSGGFEVNLGEGRERKETLDKIFRVSLGIKL
jgi:putative salt-induced outer membrane protein YdiY